MLLMSVTNEILVEIVMVGKGPSPPMANGYLGLCPSPTMLQVGPAVVVNVSVVAVTEQPVTGVQDMVAQEEVVVLPAVLVPKLQVRTQLETVEVVHPLVDLDVVCWVESLPLGWFVEVAVGWSAGFVGGYVGSPF